MLRVEGLRTKAGLRSPTITRHLVFVGNPGTGKTTVARLVGGIYRALGLLSKGQLIEVDRSELVAGYLGQTAMKTADVVTSAAGGVLFIDEAYSLAGDQYGQESVDTLVKEMEDRRDDLVLIVAGYPDPMAIFIAQNPGLASRFRTTIEFADYTDDELVEIFLGMAAAADYDVGDDCLARFKMILAITPRGPIFGNGRFARNLLEAAVGRHAWRLRDIAEPTIEQLRMLIAADLDDHDDPQPRPSKPDAETRPEPVEGQDHDPSTSSGHVSGEGQDHDPSTSSGHVPKAKRSSPMSQASPPGATAVAPAPGAPTAAAGPPAVVGAPAGTPASRSRIRDTPQRLRLLTVEVIVAGLVVGLVGALTFAYLAFSLNRAEADAAQLIRVQKIQTNLLSADATATNAFLVGGLEPPAQRAAYDQAMLAASTLIAEAARGAAGRHRGVVGAQPAAGQLRGLDRAGPGQQPAGSADRRPVPAGREYPAQGHRDSGPGQPRAEQRRSSRRRDGRPDRLSRRRLRAARAGRGDPDPGLGGPALPPPDQSRPAAQFDRPAAHRGDRADRGGAAERLGEVDQGRQLHLAERRRRGAHRRQQRQVQREPDPDRPRLRAGLRDRVVGRRRIGVEESELSGRPGRPADQVAGLHRGARRHPQAR